MTNYSILSLSLSFLPSIYRPQPPRTRWFHNFVLINLRLPTGDEMMKSWHLRADVVTLRRDTWAATRRRNSERSPPYFTGGQTPRWRQLIPTRPPWDGGGCVDLLSCLARDAAMSDLWLCCGNICSSPSPPWASELHVDIAINFQVDLLYFCPKTQNAHRKCVRPYGTKCKCCVTACLLYLVVSTRNLELSGLPVCQSDAMLPS